MKIDRQLVNNFLSLAVLQIGNYLVPLVQTPYLVRVLGAASFGRVGFSMAAAQYIVALAEYGFGLTGTRQVALLRVQGDRALAAYFWNVTWTKTFLACIAALILLICMFAFPRLQSYWVTIVPFFFWAFGMAIYPEWFFQGIEKMGVVTVINLTAKISVLPLTILLIHTPADAFLYAVLFSAIYFVAGMFGVVVAAREVKYFYGPDLRLIWEALRSGFSLFFALVGYNIYANTNALVVGLVVGDVGVGLFLGAERFLRAALQLFGPIHSAVFPRLSASAGSASARSSAVVAIKTLLKWEMSAALVISAAMILLSKYIILLFLGKNFTGSVVILQFMSPLFFFTALSSILGTLTLIPFGEMRAFSRIVIAAAVIHVATLALFVPLLGGRGAAISMVTSEAIVGLLMMMVVAKKKILKV
jgi:O-antigen/teichoic acid export membrane protein